MSAHPSLGPYALERPIGHGSFGQVWAATHVELGVRAALKVLTSRRAHNPDFQAYFANEVRAMAGLDHPAILAVYDHGKVRKEAAEASDGSLTAGSPWLAMELASGGNLAHRAAKPFAWDDVYSWLRQILSALAHAHARGIVHRDIKPTNILVCTDEDPRPGLKLSDFDLARAMDDVRAPGLAEFAAGTPYYMAPEQCEGRWRDYGPWTDLYALGCVAFELVSARRAFEGDTLEKVMAAHVRGERLELEPRIAIPDGFEAWLDLLLSRHHLGRYQCAADALGALDALGPSKVDAVAPATTLAEWAPTPGDVETEDTLPPWESSRSSLTVTLPTPPLPVLRASPDWRSGAQEEARRRSSRFAAIGLPLFHLRAHPVVARTAERDRLWRALNRVTLEGRARMVLVRGATGCGKTRLLQWLRERAAELGLAQVLHATHANTWGPSHGLPAMLGRHHRVVGLSPRDAADHLKATLLSQGISDEGEWLALAELVSPGVATNRPKMSVRLSNPTERYTVIRRALRRAARYRPVIVHLEDVHWGLESLGFVEHLLDAQVDKPLPVLVVADAGTDQLQNGAEERDALERLAKRDDVDTIDLGPLTGESRRALVRELIGLSGELGYEVEQRTAGNPMFVVQLVEDWVLKGLLEAAPDGLRLKEGAALELPGTVHAAWGARVARLLRDRGPDDDTGVQLAAVLGLAVETSQWRAACEVLAVKPSGDLVSALMDARLAVPVDGHGPNDSFAFAHAMLRESVLRRARESGRIEALHDACAQMLTRHPGPGQAERLGLHLVAAGRPQDALSHLMRGATSRMEAGDCDAALALLVRFRAALGEAVEAPTEDVRWGEAELVRCDTYLLLARLGDADACIDAALDLSSQHDWPEVLAGALIRRAEVSRMQGDLSAAHLVVDPAMRLAESLDDGVLLGRAHFERGWLYMRQGVFEDAVENFEAGYELFLEGDEVARAGDCKMGLANILQQQGRLDEAADLFEETHALYLKGGSRKGLIRLYVTRGEVARYAGLLSLAERLYRDALERCEAVGYGGVIWPLINLGVTLVQANRPDEAVVELKRTLDVAESQGRRAVAGWTHLLLAVAEAGRRGWEAYDHHLEAGVAQSDTGAVDLDVASSMERAASYALSAGELQRAKRALEIALQQWEGLRRHNDVTRVQEQLEQLRAVTG